MPGMSKLGNCAGASPISCDENADCSNHCRYGGGACALLTDCSNVCAVTGTVCTTSPDCPGTCSTSGTVCTGDGDCTGAGDVCVYEDCLANSCDPGLCVGVSACDGTPVCGETPMQVDYCQLGLGMVSVL